MERVSLLDAPEADRAEIERYIESHESAIVLRCGGKIGSDAHEAFVAMKKANSYEEPPYDFVLIGGHGTPETEALGSRAGWFRRLFDRRGRA